MYLSFLYFVFADLGGATDSPESDEISGGGSSTQDVYSDVLGAMMSSQHVPIQQQDGNGIAPPPPPPGCASSAAMAELLPGHSRNSSGTSHSGSGSASGYGSLNSQSQHSRQSSNGELGHFRLANFFHFFLFFFSFSYSNAFDFFSFLGDFFFLIFH